MYYTSPDVYTYISKQNTDPIIERKTCAVSWQQFAIFESDKKFYEKMWVPFPTLCPEERKRRRTSFRNSQSLYKRKCDATGQTIVSMYSPDKEYTVFDNDAWRSDDRSAYSYAQEYDSQEKFFVQFEKLLKRVPKMARIQQWTAENSIYTNAAADNKNCYRCFSAASNENCLFSTFIDHSVYCVDSYAIIKSQNVYDSLECGNSMNVFHSQQIDDCSNIYYSYALINCHHMLYCVWMNHMSYCILNKQVNKDERERIHNSPSDLAELKMQYDQLQQKYARWLDLVRSENVTGNSMLASTNCHFSYYMVGAEDCCYCDYVRNARYVYDMSYYGVKGTNEYIYECEGVWYGVYHIMFCKLCRWNCSDLFYCYECFNCTFCFGCAWLKNAEYCIFNKQYTKEEYEKRIAQITHDMKNQWVRWEFFPVSLSPFGYNETIAHEYYPLNRQQAIDCWSKRQDKSFDPIVPEWVVTLMGDQIPDDIATVDESMCKKILICEVTWRPYMIQKQELLFYKKHNLSLPSRHPNQRYHERLNKLPPKELHLRQCDKTWQDMLSIYSSDSFLNVCSQEEYIQQNFW